MIQPWKQISSKTIHENPWWKYQLDEFELPNGVKGEYHYMETPGSVAIVAVDHQGCISMIRQYRYLIKEISIEFPMGGIKQRQTALEAAQSELGEETHWQAAQWKSIGFFYPNDALNKERCEVFVAWELSPSFLCADKTEDIESFGWTLEELETKIHQGEIKDGPALAIWVLAKPFVEKLIREKTYL